jgi:hypothetical protein
MRMEEAEKCIDLTGEEDEPTVPLDGGTGEDTPEDDEVRVLL